MAQSLDFYRYWGKADPKYQGEPRWHPLILHLLDGAAVADALIAREPERTRERLADVLGLSWTEARPWFLLLIAGHDLGKACPGFQCKWRNLSGACGIQPSVPRARGDEPMAPPSGATTTQSADRAAKWATNSDRASRCTTGRRKAF